MRLLFATRNRHKANEVRAILRIPGLELVLADDIPGLPAVEEDGDTFESNALKKAVRLAKASGLWTLADDSGLEVDALGGRPGVLSARYAGPKATDADNNAKLLEEMRGKRDRRARFRCALALASPDGRTWTVDGRCEGRIGAEIAGRNGFGYDPLFLPDEYKKTFAELKPDEKNAMSHRARALKKAQEEWSGLLQSTR